MGRLHADKQLVNQLLWTTAPYQLCVVGKQLTAGLPRLLL